MIDVIDLSYFIVKRTNDNNNPISHLQLQKLLFFLQKMNLERNKVPLFKEKIYAWDFGTMIREVYIEEYFSSFNNILKTSLGDKEIKDISLKECIEILDKKNIYFYIPDLIYSYNRRKKVKNFKEIEDYFSQMVQKEYENTLKEKPEKIFNLLLSFFEKEVMEKFYQNQFLNRLGLLEDEKTLEKEINTFFKELETKYFEKTEIKPLLETI